MDLEIVHGALPFAVSPLRSVFAGIDHLLAQHVAHLFIRDPLTLFEEKIHLDDANESDHFEVSPVQVHFTSQTEAGLFMCL